MILVDTNIIIDFWKNPTTIIKKILLENDVFICGVVKAELLYGAKDENQYEKIMNALSDFPMIDIYPLFWNDLGLNLFKLKKSGLTIPFQDLIIATLAIKNKFSILSNDKHFKKIATVLDNLVVYSLNDD